jgi:uncharacterized protein YbjT (DUF2867 family)
MTVLVTGGTGNVGSVVVHELLHSGHDVRVLTRDAGRARQVLGGDVDVVVTDLADRPGVDRALAGVDRVFLAMGNEPGQVTAECTVIDAAAAASVERLVKLSGPAPHPDSPLVVEQWHARIESHLAASGLPAVALRPASFMTNLLAFAEPVATTGVLPAPTAGARVAFVDPRDVGCVAAALLVAERPPEARTVRVTGPAAVTYDEVATALTAVLGREVAFVPVTDDAARAAMADAGLPELLVEAFLAVYRMQREGRFGEVADTVPVVLGRPARGVEDFLDEHRSLFGAPAPRPTR